MDYDDNDSQGHTGEGNSKSSPVLRSFALPKYDFDDSLQGHLRFESLVENEVFLGISSQEDSQWIEDYSRANSGIEFSSNATEPCSISRHNNVWSEATSSESVAMLLKSVGQEEQIQGETLIRESDTGNELGRLTKEMDPNLKQDDITNSQSTANPNSFLDGRNVNALESKKDNLPVDGSSGVVSVVSRVIMSEADVRYDDKCTDTKHLEVNIIEQPQVDNLEGLTPEIHVRDVISMLPSDVASSSVFNGQESIKQHKAETNITSINELSKLEENVTCDIQIEEACKIDQGSAVPSQLGNVEFRACNEGEDNCEPLQDPLCDSSSVACLDAHAFEVVNKDTEYSARTGVEISIAELKENSFGNQANSPEIENVDIKTGNSSCPEHDMESIVENENSENRMGGVAVAEASLVPDVDHKLTEQGEGSGTEHVGNPDISLSCTVSGSQYGKQLSPEDLSDIKTSIVLEDDNSPEAQTSSLVVGGHVQMSKSNLSSGQEDVHSFGKDVSCPGREDAKSPTTSLCPDESNKANLVHGSEFLKSASNGRGSEVTEEMNLSSCDMLTDPPLLSGSKTTADGVTLGEQEQKSQDTNLLGIENSPQVLTDLEAFGFPESGQASRIDQEAGPGCSTKVEACPALNNSHIKLVDDTAPAARKNNEEISVERNAELALHEVAGSEVTVEMNLSSCDMPTDPQLLSGSKTTADMQTDPQLLSGSKTTADGVTLGEQEQKSQDTNLLGIENSPQVSTDLEPFGFPESGQASRIDQEAGPGCSKKVEACPALSSSDIKLVDDTAPAARKNNEEISVERNAELAWHEVAGSEVTEEMNLSSCDTLTDPPLLPGSKTTADGVTLGEQEQKSQDTNILGIENSPQVSTDLEPFGFPESGQASRIDQEAGPGCSTEVEACPALNSSDIKLVDDTAPAARKNNEEISVETNAELALHEIADAVLPSSQSVVPPESVSVSIVESSNMFQKDHEVIVTSGTHLTENPSTKVDSPEKNQASVSLACPSKCIADSGNKDGDASANSFEESAYPPPSIISCAKTPLSENEQQTRTKEVSIGNVQHSKATHGAGEMVKSVSLLATSNNGESSTFEVNLSTGVTEGETINGLQSYPVVQVHKESTDVKEYPSEGNPGSPSVVSCLKIPLSESGQKTRGKDASDSTVRHSDGSADAGGKVQSAALHMEHDNPDEGKNISIEVSSSTGLSENEIIKGSPSYPSIPVNKISTDVDGYPLAADCSRIDLTTVNEHSLESSEGPGPMSGKKRAGAKGTSERKMRQVSVKTSARANAKKRGVQETPLKQFEGDKSMMILSSPETRNAELSGIKACGAFPTPMSNIPDLNTSVTPAYLQQSFTDPQQVQLRAQILVHGSLMQNSVPDEACMIAAFGPSDGGGGCLWEPAWRSCSERIHTQKSDANNLETPVRLFSGSKGSDQPIKKTKSSRQSKSPLPTDRASSKGTPSPVVNPIIPLSSPLWNVSTPSCVGLQSSGTYVGYHQSFTPLQPYQAQGTRGFVEQSPSWSQTNFPSQWVATPQNSALDVNACVSSMFCTEPVKLTPPKVSSVPSHPAIKQTQFSVSTGGGAVVSTVFPFQTDINKASILPGQNSVNPKHKKRKKVSVSNSPGQMASLTLDQAASISDTSNHPSEKATAPQAIFQNYLPTQSLPEMRSPSVNNASSTPNAATATSLGSTGQSGNNLPVVSPLILSDQPMRVDQSVDKNGIISEESLNAVEEARLQAEGAAAHAAAAVGNCNDVWSQLSKLKNSGLRFDDETKLSSAAMAIAAAASVAKAAAAAAKLASNVAIGVKLMADEVSTTSVTRNNTHSTGISFSRSSNSSLLAGEGNVSASSIIAAAKETVKKRVEAATAASKHAENLDALIKAAELAAEAVSQAGKIVSIGDPLPLSKLVGSGPMDYWRTPQVSPEQGVKAYIDQHDTFDSEKLVPAEPPKDGAIITGEAVNLGTVASIGQNSATTQRGHRASDPALDSYGGTNSETVNSCDAHRTAPQISLENGMVEGCVVEVFKEGVRFKAAWYSAKILNINDGKAFVCYTDLEADDGSGKLKEWVPLKGDDFKAPAIRIPHPTTSMCFDRSRKRRRAAVMDYTWCVGDRVDAWMQDCWLEGVVQEKSKNDETTLTISIPALGGTSAVKSWHLRPTVAWQDGKWIEWPSAIQQSPTQGDTPQEKRVKLGHPAVEAAKEDNILRSNDLVESKEHEESRQLPLLANEKEFNIGNNTKDIKLDAPRIARTGLQKEGSRVVFGVPKPGKKRKFMDVSKQLDSDQCNKNTKTSDSVKTARYLPQGRGGGRSWNNNTKVDIKEKQAAEGKPKVFRSGKSQSVSGRVLPQKTNSLVSAKSTGKTVSKEENNPALRDLMEFGSVSDSPSEGPTSSKGLTRFPRNRVPSSSTKSVQLNKGKRAAGGEFDKKVEQDKSFAHVAEPRRSSRKIQPTSRLLEGLQSSLIGSKMPSVPHEKIQRNLNRGDNSSHG